MKNIPSLQKIFAAQSFETRKSIYSVQWSSFHSLIEFIGEMKLSGHGMVGPTAMLRFKRRNWNMISKHIGQKRAGFILT